MLTPAIRFNQRAGSAPTPGGRRIPPREPALPHARPEKPCVPGRLLITAGPTQEPIDAVRFIGNRSSGRLGVALAKEAVRRAWDTTLMLGPTPLPCEVPGARVTRFRTTEDLARLLDEHFTDCDVLIMAAAVADFRPVSRQGSNVSGNKWRRSDGHVTLELEPTPDLLARCADRRRPGQTLVGFALEPEDRLLESAREKLGRKGVDLVVANPLETMDAATIRAFLLTQRAEPEGTDGPIAKDAFASWLLDRVESFRRAGKPTARPA